MHLRRARFETYRLANVFPIRAAHFDDISNYTTEAELLLLLVSSYGLCTDFHGFGNY